MPLKLRDGAHALSSLPPLLASILLAPKPKKARPPHLGAGHERQTRTLHNLGDAGRRAGKLERKGNPTTPIYSCVGHQASGLSKDKGLGPPVTARHSTSKGCPRLPRRDATERNKAKLSPWTLNGAASAQADRLRTARRKATRTKALNARQRDESASCRAAGAIVALAPSARRHVLSPEQTNKKARASKYFLCRRITPTDELSHPLD